jgi:hypothetical protein
MDCIIKLYSGDPYNAGLSMPTFLVLQLTESRFGSAIKQLLSRVGFYTSRSSRSELSDGKVPRTKPNDFDHVNYDSNLD